MELTDFRQRITIDPAIRFGKLCVRGTRLTVGDVLGYLAGGMTEDEILEDFDQLELEDVRACREWVASQPDSVTYSGGQLTRSESHDLRVITS